MSSPVRRPGLIASFALTSLVLIAALGVVLAGSVARVIRDRNLESAERTAELASRLAIQSQLTTASVSDGLPPEALRRLDRELKDGVLGRAVTRLNIWNRTHAIVYSSEASLIGSRTPPGDEARLDAALAGTSSSKINDKTEVGAPGDAALGHLSGDLLLRDIGPRLQAALRDDDTVARLGGDEFAVLLPSVPGIEAAVAVAQKIREALSEPYSLDGLTVEADASIGVALSPEHGEDAPTLLQRADVAMYVAKRSATGVEVYAAEHDRNSRRRLTLVGDLRRAIAAGELLVRYQPIVDM